jgi:sugar lactone lactonase YvrE
MGVNMLMNTLYFDEKRGMEKITTQKSGVLIAIAAILCSFAGCQPGDVSQKEQEPIFYPPFPDKPRIQFLKSFSGVTDLDFEGKRKASAFEKFVVGEATDWEQTEILKPFGMTLYEGKLYVCDVGRSAIEVIDLKTGKFSMLTKDRRLMAPGNIVIDKGNKYVSDARAGAVFVFDKNNRLAGIWGKQESIVPVDVDIYEDKLYVLDSESAQVVLFDKITGKELKRIGKKIKNPKDIKPGELNYVTGLTVDYEGNIYVVDTVNARVTKFDKEGIFQQITGFQSRSIHGLIRPKGIDVDKEGRLWIIDAMTNVAKIYNSEGQLLLFFGMHGMQPGQLYLPASVRVDYDHIEYFQKYAVEDAQLECLILVSNQFGPNKISAYGLGKFPEQEKKAEAEMLRRLKQEEGGTLLKQQQGDEAEESGSSKPGDNDKEDENSNQGEKNELDKQEN